MSRNSGNLWWFQFPPGWLHEFWCKHFYWTAGTFVLLQHVSLPTHVLGHTLDLLITKPSNDICICSTHVSSLRMSDHYFVHGKFSIPRPRLSVERVKFRKLKQTTVEAFIPDLKASDLSLLRGATWTIWLNVIMRHSLTFLRVTPLWRQKLLRWYPEFLGSVKS